MSVDFVIKKVQLKTKSTEFVKIKVLINIMGHKISYPFNIIAWYFHSIKNIIYRSND